MKKLIHCPCHLPADVGFDENSPLMQNETYGSNWKWSISAKWHQKAEQYTKMERMWRLLF